MIHTLVLVPIQSALLRQSAEGEAQTSDPKYRHHTTKCVAGLNRLPVVLQYARSVRFQEKDLKWVRTS
jgi:hypothetical protein